MSDGFSIEPMRTSGMNFVQENGSINLNGLKKMGANRIIPKSSNENELVAFEDSDDKSGKKGTIKEPRIVKMGGTQEAPKTKTEDPGVHKTAAKSKTKKADKSGKTEKSQETGKTEEPKTDKPGTKDNPRVVQQTPEEMTKQMAVIKGIFDTLVDMDQNLGIKGLEVTDNVIYQDQNGNPTRQVVTKENSKGETVKIIIEYDSSGRITKISERSGDDDKPSLQDGKVYRVEYLSDGRAKISLSDEVENEADGTSKVWLTMRPSWIVYPDGSTEQNNIFGHFDGTGFKGGIPIL